MALMYKLPKMQRTLKDGRTHQTENGSAVSEGSSHGCPSFFFTRIIAEYHGTDIILRKSRNTVESRNKKRNP